MSVRADLARQQRFRCAPRGFSLMELLVAISIIALLMALILPAIQNARSAARRTTCLNNLHNLGVAVHGYATVYDDPLPYLTSELGRGDGQPVEYSWVVELLPFLEHGGLYQRLTNYDGPSADGPYAGSYPSIGVLVCPGSTTGSSPGDFSYVANAGYIRGDLWGDNTGHNAETINWDRNCECTPLLTQADRPYAYATGVFWRRLSDDTFRQRLLQISDGMSRTFMVSENLQAGTYDAETTGRIAFGISISVDPTIAPWHISTGAQGLCMNNCPMRTRPGSGSPNLLPLATFNLHDAENDNNARINAESGGSTGEHPRPSSNHSGGVNMLWCDARATFINENIDEQVYVYLISTAGERYEQPIVSPPN